MKLIPDERFKKDRIYYLSDAEEIYDYSEVLFNPIILRVKFEGREKSVYRRFVFDSRIDRYKKFTFQRKKLTGPAGNRVGYTRYPFEIYLGIREVKKQITENIIEARRVLIKLICKKWL